MSKVFNEHTRGPVTCVVLGLIVSLSGCKLLNTPNQDAMVIDSSESLALASKLNQQGIHHVQHNQLGKAEFKFEEAIHANPNFGPAYNNLGLVFFHQHDFFEAARAFEAAHDKWPDSPEPLNNLGLVMETVARPYEAIDLYQQAYELAPTNSEYLGNLLRAKVRLDLIDDELLEQLHRLLLIEQRTEWQDWAREQLGLSHNPTLDRGPAQPSSDPLSELTNRNPSIISPSNSSRSSPLSSDLKPDPSKSPIMPEEILELPAPARKTLPGLEPLQLPSPIVPIPSATPLPEPSPSGEPSIFPTSLPPSSRRQK